MEYEIRNSGRIPTAVAPEQVARDAAGFEQRANGQGSRDQVAGAKFSDPIPARECWRTREAVLLNKFIRHIPRPETLRGGWLHRILGERLFHPALWRPTRVQVAGGLALGVFVALTPTMGVQMFIAGIAAFFLRLNIPISLAACWITNPLSAPVVYGLQYELGLYLSGTVCDPQLIHSSTLMENAMYLAKPLWIGSLVSAAFFAPLAYLAVVFGWPRIAHRIEVHRLRAHRVSRESKVES